VTSSWFSYPHWIKLCGVLAFVRDYEPVATQTTQCIYEKKTPISNLKLLKKEQPIPNSGICSSKTNTYILHFPDRTKYFESTQ